MPEISTLDRLLEIIPDPSPRAAAKILDHLDEQALAFIALSPFIFVTTDGPDGLEVSPKGDAPGFVEILDNKTLLIPERDGNHLKMGLKNIIDNGRIALIFLVPNSGEAVRVSGRASLTDDADVCARLSFNGKPALLATRVEIDRAFFHCPRAIKRARIWEPDSWTDPVRISFGKIYAKALGQPEIVEAFDKMSEEHNAQL